MQRATLKRHDPFGLWVALHFIAAMAIFLVAGNLSWYQSAAGLITETPTPALLTTLRVAETLLQTGLFSFVMCMYMRDVLRRSPDYFRVRLCPQVRRWVLAGIAAPLALTAFYLVACKGTVTAGTLALPEGIVLTVFSAGLKPGITEELLFRGFLLRIMEDRWGARVAVGLSSFLFAFVRLGNAPGITGTEIILMLMAYTAAGVTFVLITRHTGSILPAILMHALWNIIAEGNLFRIIVSQSQFDPNAVWNLTVDGGNVWLTGGFFGISATLPGIIAFLSPLLLLLMERRQAGRA